MKSVDQYPEEQAEKRRDEALKRMLSTPPQPFTPPAKKASAKPKK